MTSNHSKLAGALALALTGAALLGGCQRNEADVVPPATETPPTDTTPPP